MSMPNRLSSRSTARFTSERTPPCPLCGSEIQKPIVSSSPSAAKLLSDTDGEGSDSTRGTRRSSSISCGNKASTSVP